MYAYFPRLLLQMFLLARSLPLFVSGHGTGPTIDCGLVKRTLSQKAQQAGMTGYDLLDMPGPSRVATTLDVIPDICKEVTGPGKECSATMQAINVSMSDCGSPWTLCYCSNANITLDASMDYLARVPIGLRRFVNTVMIMPDISAHAYTLAGNIHFFGVCSQRTWVHESTHAADHGRSASTAWINAVDSDTCVPDNYAQSNLVEDFAQVSVLKTYSMLHDQLPTGWTADCMSNQLAYMSSIPWYDSSTFMGDTCAFSDPDGTALHTAPPSQTASDSIIPGSYSTVLPGSTVATCQTAATPPQSSASKAKLNSSSRALVSSSSDAYIARFLLLALMFTLL